MRGSRGPRRIRCARRSGRADLSELGGANLGGEGAGGSGGRCSTRRRARVDRPQRPELPPAARRTRSSSGSSSAPRPTAGPSRCSRRPGSPTTSTATSPGGSGRPRDSGEILDPVADRLYILAVVIGLAIRDIVPWWFAIVLPLRDVLLWGLVPILRTRGYSALPVHFLGQGGHLQPALRVPAVAPRRRHGQHGHAREGVRLGVRRVGDRPVLVGRGPLRLPGLQAGEDDGAAGDRPWLRHP